MTKDLITIINGLKWTLENERSYNPTQYDYITSVIEDLEEINSSKKESYLDCVYHNKQ